MRVPEFVVPEWFPNVSTPVKMGLAWFRLTQECLRPRSPRRPCRFRALDAPPTPLRNYILPQDPCAECARDRALLETQNTALRLDLETALMTIDGLRAELARSHSRTALVDHSNDRTIHPFDSSSPVIPELEPCV